MSVLCGEPPIEEHTGITPHLGDELGVHLGDCRGRHFPDWRLSSRSGLHGDTFTNLVYHRTIQPATAAPEPLTGTEEVT